MDKQKFYEQCAALYEWMEQEAAATNARTMHCKLDLPGGGHYYFEVRRGSHG